MTTTISVRSLACLAFLLTLPGCAGFALSVWGAQPRSLPRARLEVIVRKFHATAHTMVEGHSGRVSNVSSYSKFKSKLTRENFHSASCGDGTPETISWEDV